MEFGKDVFAVPGPVTSERSAGALDLLRDGAILARDAKDILQELPEGPDPAPEVVVPTVPENLPPQEARVLDHLGAGAPVAVDTLARESGVPLGTLLDALVSLEVRRLVRSLPGGRYMRGPEKM